MRRAGGPSGVLTLFDAYYVYSGTTLLAFSTIYLGRQSSTSNTGYEAESAPLVWGFVLVHLLYRDPVTGEIGVT